MTNTHYRNCNLCEAMCGLEITYQNTTVIKNEGDKNDPFSRGHICPKAVALKDIYEDPNRLKFPMLKTAEGWQEISWNEAFDLAALKIKYIQTKYGNNAVAMYQGNPSIHNLGTTLNSPALAKSLKTKNIYSATSTDQLPHHFASMLMFGHPMLLPVPDIDHTDFMLIMGANPIASNGSMMTVPDVAHRLKAIQKRGGKVIVVDPRRTETAEMANQYLPIVPGTDAYFLLGILNILFAKKLVDLARLPALVAGLDLVEKIAKTVDLQTVTELTKVSETELTKLATDFANAKTAVCYGRVGLSTQAYGGLCNWLVNLVNILTGNFDETGGAMFTTPAVDILANAENKQRFNRWQSRVRGLPEFLGELPVAVLAEEIETPGDGQIKMLITSCGNPVLSIPNGGGLDGVLPKLEFMISIDIYLNETSRNADLILPPATGLEVPHYDLTFHTLAVRNTSKYAPPLFEKHPNARYDWEIYQELTNRVTGAIKPLTPPEHKLDLGLRFGPYQLSLEKLKEHPHGIDLGPLKSQLPARLLTSDKKINLAPELLVNDLQRLYSQNPNNDLQQQYPFILIGRRHLRDNNSWMHNSQRLMKGRNRCTLMMHPTDAQSLGLTHEAAVTVKSKRASLQVPLELTENIMPGVVSMPHGYGHNKHGSQLTVASQYAGVSVNDLTDHEVIDELTGNAAFSNVRVQVSAVE